MAVQGRTEWSTGQLISNLLFHVFSFLFVLILLPIFLPISLLLRFYRHFLIYQIEKKHKDFIIANHNDAIWFQDTRTNMAIINTLILLKGKPDVKKFQEVMNSRLVQARGADGQLMFPKFTRYNRKVLRRDVWIEEENYDITEHVYLWDKSIPQTRAELESLLGYLCSQPLPEGKSQWQAILVPSASHPDDQFYMVFRVHHSIADGIALTRVFMTKVVDVPPEQHRPLRFGARNKWLRAIKAVFTGPAILMQRLTMPMDRNVLHGPKLSGDKLVAWSDQLDLTMIKRMKEAAGCTVNDIIMSCLAGAFREYLNRNASRVPNHIQAYVPVDIRANHDVNLDNQFALVFFPLPLGMEDPLQQLKATKASMDAIKTSAEPLLNALTITYLMARFPTWITKLLFNNMSDKCSMVLSNVPGPQSKLFIAGYALEEAIFWPPQRANVGMGISVLSYNGHVKMGFIVDRSILSNPSVLVNNFVEQVNRLAKLLRAA